MKRALLLSLAPCSSAAAGPLLTPVKGNQPAAEWKRQLLSAPTYHGTFTRKVHSVEGSDATTTTGTIASDPAHRKLHVHTKTKFSQGTDHYEREVDLVIDGTRARLTGSSAESSHTSTAKLPAQFAPDAPFGDVPNADAGFTFAGDLRETVLDCLANKLEPAAAHAWRVKPDAAAAVTLMVARHDPALVSLDGKNGEPEDPCAGAEILADKDGTLRGIRWNHPERRFQSASVEELSFDLTAGAPNDFEISDSSLSGATKMDRGLEKQRGLVDAVVADPKRQAAIKATMK